MDEAQEDLGPLLSLRRLILELGNRVHVWANLKWKQSLRKTGSVPLNFSLDFSGSPVVKTSPSNAGGVCSIQGQGAKIPHALQPKNQNIKQKQYCNEFNKDLKNGPYQKHLLKNPKTKG